MLGGAFKGVRRQDHADAGHDLHATRGSPHRPGLDRSSGNVSFEQDRVIDVEGKLADTRQVGALRGVLAAGDNAVKVGDNSLRLVQVIPAACASSTLIQNRWPGNLGDPPGCSLADRNGC